MAQLLATKNALPCSNGCLLWGNGSTWVLMEWAKIFIQNFFAAKVLVWIIDEDISDWKIHQSTICIVSTLWHSPWHHTMNCRAIGGPDWTHPPHSSDGAIALQFMVWCNGECHRVLTLQIVLRWIFQSLISSSIIQTKTLAAKKFWMKIFAYSISPPMATISP